MQDFAWVGVGARSKSVWGGSGGIFLWEILKNQFVEVHFSCILRDILTFLRRLSRPLWHLRGASQPLPTALIENSAMADPKPR